LLYLKESRLSLKEIVDKRMSVEPLVEEKYA
jgi:hypothetical protein